MEFSLDHKPVRVNLADGREVVARGITLRGYLDAAAREAILAAFEPLQGNVLVDFEGVRRINSMGIATLLKAFKEAQHRGCQLRFVSLSELNRKVFQMTGLLTLGRCCDSEAEAMESLV